MSLWFICIRHGVKGTHSWKEPPTISVSHAVVFLSLLFFWALELGKTAVTEVWTTTTLELSFILYFFFRVWRNVDSNFGDDRFNITSNESGNLKGQQYIDLPKCNAFIVFYSRYTYVPEMFFEVYFCFVN